MNDLRKAAEMALDALDMYREHDAENIGLADAAYEALRQALAQPEWVCCVCGEPEALGIVHSADAPCFHYTKREWVGLTDEEMRALKQKSVDDGMTRVVSDFEYIRSIEAKLKEKNT